MPFNYHNIPIEPQLFKELKGIKQEAEAKIGGKLTWNLFLDGLIQGSTNPTRRIISEIVNKWRLAHKEVR